jgi:hypothetical protein
MATRSTISIIGITYASVYKHWDGSPKSTLPWLEKFNKEFTEKRGDDPEYKFAQLLRSSVRMAEEFGLDGSTETGWGVVPFGCTEEYNYFLHPDGSVTYTEG